MSADRGTPDDLNYVSDESPGIRRRRSGKGFSYLTPAGELIRDREILSRIRSLVIPPAWTDVWIAPDPLGHLQATGRDNRARKQYRYHPAFRQAREGAKYDHMITFASVLPMIRAKVAEHLSLRGLPREKVLATVVHLLERTHIRIGNSDYAKQNRSYGLTTLRSAHVSIERSELRFDFKGKSGKLWQLRVTDRRVAKIVRACQELPGQHLFQYLDEEGRRHEISSADVNRYLHEISAKPVTAKDFRTWAGTVLAARALMEMAKPTSPTHARRMITAALKTVAARLGNTVAVCRQCYVHPVVMDRYAKGKLRARKSSRNSDSEILAAEELAVLAMVRGAKRRKAIEPKAKKEKRSLLELLNASAAAHGGD